MRIHIDTKDAVLHKELMELCALFFADIQKAEKEQSDLLITHQERLVGNLRSCRMTLSKALEASAETVEKQGATSLKDKRLWKRQTQKCLYQTLKEATGKQPPWGSLTGIRPGRLVVEKMGKGLSLDDALHAMTQEFDVRPGKAALLGEVIRNQQAIPPATEKDVDIYIGIPFCPTRCRYCSFISEARGKGDKLVRYTKELLREIEQTKALIERLELNVRAVYFGGGTPTVLEARELEQVLKASRSFINHAMETTVEAGRPDTITREKLELLKKSGVDRISINPQSFHDRTLELIGRGHTCRQTLESYQFAQEFQFSSINMDVIAGLPGESPEDFRYTMSVIEELAPQSLTVHTLSIKRSSAMHQWGDKLPSGDWIKEMVEGGYQTAKRMGLAPYYLYRQKHQAGGHENVGYAQKGKACVYNIDTMEDTASVIAIGAGGISKRVWQDRVFIARAPNNKGFRDYVENVDEMVLRKEKLFTMERPV